MHQVSIFCYKVVHVQNNVWISNLIYQICKDNRANKHGEKKPPKASILLSFKWSLDMSHSKLQPSMPPFLTFIVNLVSTTRILLSFQQFLANILAHSNTTCTWLNDKFKDIKTTSTGRLCSLLPTNVATLALGSRPRQGLAKVQIICDITIVKCHHLSWFYLSLP